jgi:hypothetical protein
MIQKYFSIVIILTSIIVVSCRQDNEPNTQREDSSLLKKANEGDFMKNSDSSFVGVISTYPPKNGTHYKNDSITLDDDINDPPKNGTHYKGK